MTSKINKLGWGWMLMIILSVAVSAKGETRGIKLSDQHSSNDQFTRIYEGAPVTDEDNSRGACWIDYDNDGYLDLFVTNRYGYEPRNCLYHNNGNGTFTKVTSGTIVSEGGSLGSCWGDVDNDNDLDVICANPGYSGTPNANYFYINNNGISFTKITDDTIATDVAFSTSPAWADYNNDGYLDLFVGTDCFSPGCSAPPALYLNEGGGIFSKLNNSEIGLTEDFGGGVWSDYDGDGDLDLYIWRDWLNTNAMFENNGNGTFTEIDSGVIVEDSAYSCSWADYDNDGDLDLFIARASASWKVPNILYQNTEAGDFVKVTGQEVVNDSGLWHCSSWADYDNDGDLDLYVTSHYPFYSTPNALYENNGDGTFSKITQGVIVNDTGFISSSGIWGDYDRDGDLDLYVTNQDFKNNLLYRNNGNSNNWINIKLIGTLSNRSAIGTKVRLKATIAGIPVWQLREISSQTSYLCQNSMNAHFGLGDAILVDSLKIEWPSGIVDVIANMEVNQFVYITETLCGDTNGDVDIGVSDVVYLVNYLFKGGFPPHCTPEPYNRCADVNSDYDISVSDVVYLINYLFKGGPAPGC